MNITTNVTACLNREACVAG